MVLLEIKEVLSEFDIKLNNRKMASCPFHEDKTPSFSVNTQKNLFHCFSCNRSGDAIQLKAYLLGISNNQMYKEVVGGKDFTKYNKAQNRGKSLLNKYNKIDKYELLFEKQRELKKRLNHSLIFSDKWCDTIDKLSKIQYMLEWEEEEITIDRIRAIRKY